MSKIYNEPVEVSIDREGKPLAFVWRNHVYLVTSCTIENNSFICGSKEGCKFQLEKREGGWFIVRIWS